MESDREGAKTDRAIARAMTRITIVREGLLPPLAEAGERIIADGELRRLALSGGLLRHVQGYSTARLLTERLSTSGRPMLAWALRLMARDRCYIADADGQERDITLGVLVRWSMQVMREAVGRGALLRAVEREIEALEHAPPRAAAWNPRAVPLYLRTDLSFGVRAGGSVGHIAGVANELARVLRPPVFVSTASVPTLGADVEVHPISVPERFWNFQEVPAFALNDVCTSTALDAVGARDVAFVYQRYSLNNFSGLQLARQLRVPLILEYNGSEIWMSRHWSRPLKYEALASRIERLNVMTADLVVVVSRAMRDELVARGVDAERVLMNPNAVDPDRYSPSIDGGGVRARVGLGGALVIGFISTFSPWHGAPVLARAFVEFLQRHPEHRGWVRLLMIGNGADAEPCRQIIADAGFADAAIFTGLVPQQDGPAYLAACDLLVSPHVPNPDGTPFFGSPTKLFEYMAMGRGIIASDLDQIGEVLRHNDTAWLVPPADVQALADGLAALVADAPLRDRLGAAARQEVLAHHTWRAHVDRTLAALAARVPPSRG
jgi:glycosyltransferase involved in cell wall biosynthesis